MEVGRLLLAAGFFGFAGAAFYLFTESPPDLVVSSAELSPMNGGYALVADISNQGEPTYIHGLASETAGQAMIVGTKGPVALPSGTDAQFSMSGVHGMLMDVHGDMAEGRIVPVTFWFGDQRKIHVRAKVTGSSSMDHGEKLEVPASDQVPEISLSVDPYEGQFILRLETSNFQFSAEAVDGDHTQGTGHAHLFLNGLKLSRIFDTTFELGALPPGTHQIRVTLNTNDHRQYFVDGQPVEATQSVDVE